jgi:hypothetical protein
MDLHTKYLAGFAILGALGISYFMLIPISPLIAYLYLGLSSSYIGVILIIIGLSIFAIGSIFYNFLYSSERIKGIRAEYEISPDLTKFKVSSYSDKESRSQDEEIPTEAFCSKCGKKIFKPFKCSICKQVLCGKHYLPGEHQCEEGQL